MSLNPRITKVGIAATSLVAGVVLAGTLGAQAATPSPTPSTGSSSNAVDPHPGDNGADGIPESQEHHGGFGRGGHGLDLSGTVTAVGSNSVTIKTSSTTTTYAVTSTSDIDKDGEANLKALVVGDAVRFSVDPTHAKQIDKLHAGDEAKDRPQSPPPAGSTPGA